MSSSSSSTTAWTREEEKAFENAIADYWDEVRADKWETIASIVPSKTISELKLHCKSLDDDLDDIDSDLIPDAKYAGEEESNSADEISGVALNSGNRRTGKRVRAEQERRKGTPWTADEHKRFLLGLEKFGKGDWRSISRNYVNTRTPTQVASHAQKYFIRMNSNHEKRRTSIHDITSVDDGDVSLNQDPITDQPGGSNGAPIMHMTQPNVTPAMGMHGTPMDHPVAPVLGHESSAIGTPVMLPPSPYHPYAALMAFPMGPPPTQQ